MHYENPVYRPPSEAYSLIVQITNGCSHNGCTFCNMYKGKAFRINPLEQVFEDFDEARLMYGYVDRVFLADGDALIYPAKDLVDILEYIKKNFPEVKRISSYATPRSLLLKSEQELSLIHEKGLDMLYLGLESGSDKVLSLRNKGETSEKIVEAGKKGIDAGFKVSVTILSGLGGVGLLEEHALETAKALTAMKPHYIGEMTLNIIPGTKLYEEAKSGDFVMPDPKEILRETRLIIENTDDEGAVFRSNHVSNYINIRGTFNEGKNDMIRQIDSALKNGNFKVRHYTNM